MGLFDKHDAPPAPFEIRGRALTCQICRNTTFHERRAQLHGGLATLFNVEWASPSAACLICSECGYVHWFMPRE